MTESAQEPKRRAKGDGGLTYDEKRNLWVGVVWVRDANGERKQKRVSSRQKSVARAKLIKLRADVINKRVTVGGGQIRTVGEWLDYWLAEIAKPRVKPKTLKSYEGTVRLYIKPHIGDTKLDKLTPADVRDMIKKLRESSTRNAEKAYTVLNMALKKAVSDERLTKNVCKAVDKPAHNAKPRGAFELNTAVHVLKTAAARDDEDVPGRPKLASRFVAAFMTGARQAELLGLTWDRVDFEAGFIDIEWQLQRMQYVHGCGTKPDGSPKCGKQRYGYCPDRKWDFDPAFEYKDCYRSLVFTRPKSEAGNRLVPMAPLLLESLKVHKKLDKDPNPHNLVWHHRDGRPISQEDDNEQWNELIAAAGIEKQSREVVLHEARNTAATMLLESGVDAKVIQSIMGHASILQTRHYQRVSMELSKTAVANTFDALLPDV